METFKDDELEVYEELDELRKKNKLMKKIIHKLRLQIKAMSKCTNCELKRQWELRDKR